MKLAELDPRWCSTAGRHGMGISFNCPCCLAKGILDRWVVYFAKPIDGGEPFPMEPGQKDRMRWSRQGDTFETLTLAPSVNLTTDGNERLGVIPVQHWHGFFHNGEVITV